MSRRLRHCRADPLRPRETQLRPSQGLYYRGVRQSSQLFSMSLHFRKLLELVVPCLQRPLGPRCLPESVAARSSRVRQPSFAVARPHPLHWTLDFKCCGI
ncbi:hypothetical protein NDU88_002778 [Pleurodeles waltl]|uniref:Uncharacterized protein n=1 Tax=Pleurodeles waltl TaxID=8319 RepID=A0AAV7UYS8_PLEWA|nr:hypothetical protein NDU88_002778 [Pleurodeles waltl]